MTQRTAVDDHSYYMKREREERAIAHLRMAEEYGRRIDDAIIPLRIVS